MAAALGVGLFLLVSPPVEREAHLSVVRDGEQANIESSMRHLCWIESGVTGLNELLPGLDVERRREILQTADSLGCLSQLAPSIQASYFIIEADGTGHVEKAMSFEEAALEPALEAIEYTDPAVARRGATVLAVLARRLTPDQQQRTAAALDNLPPSSERTELARRLRLVPPGPGPGAETETTMGKEEDVRAEPFAGAGAGSDFESFKLREPTLEIESDGLLFAAPADPDAESADEREDDDVHEEEPREPEEVVSDGDDEPDDAQGTQDESAVAPSPPPRSGKPKRGVAPAEESSDAGTSPEDGGDDG